MLKKEVNLACLLIFDSLLKLNKLPQPYSNLMIFDIRVPRIARSVN
jgi:hypothetical protein